MISIQTHIPQALSPFIKSFWCLKVAEDLSQPYIEEVLPDGHHEIIFHLNSSSARRKSCDEKWHTDPTVYLTGQNRKSYIQKLNPGATIYAVRFHPHTQTLFYDFPASISTDNLIPLSDISANEIISHCISESAINTFVRLEKEFTKKAAELKNYGPSFFYVDAAVREILKNKGNVKIEFLEKITGVSSRHLERSFHKYVGLSPKQFCNIIRYGNFVNYRKNYPEKSLTECAHATDFYDQSHLIHLSHQLLSKSPKDYFNKSNYINDFFLNS